MALALVGCSSGGDDAESAGESTTSAEATAGAPSGSAGEDAEIEPAKRQEIIVDEVKTVSTDDEAFTVTVNKAIVNDYYVEVELRIVNDGDNALTLWSDHATYKAPRLFDDKGRTYAFRPEAGAKDSRLSLQGAEGLDAVLVFAGRLDATAQRLTLDLSEMGDHFNQVEFAIPVKAS